VSSVLNGERRAMKGVILAIAVVVPRWCSQRRAGEVVDLRRRRLSPWAAAPG